MSSEALCHFIGNGSSHGLLGKGLVVVEVVVLNDTFQSDKTRLPRIFLSVGFTLSSERFRKRTVKLRALSI
jgi:hypothetical protein